MNVSLQILKQRFINNVKIYRKYYPSTILCLKTSQPLNTVNLIDDLEEISRKKHSLQHKLNSYTYRTHTCGQLTSKNVGEDVILCGWLEFQRMNRFAVLRDAYGHTQVIVKDDDKDNQKLLDNIPYESIVKIKGTIVLRPPEMANKASLSGTIEVLADKITVLNPADTKLPYNIRDFQRAKETLRMQYRYLDLRFADMQRNLRMRSDFIMRMRHFLVNKAGFVDVDTPTLFRATPGGAREFIVPTRFPGEFYSLVQSPQQFKQILMAGGVDRYFQVARCYRDETSRPDRQPEFTQLDLELSFTSVDNVLALTEDLLQFSWPHNDSVALSLPKSPFPRLDYNQAMEKYGTDKPDLRIPFLLNNCTELFTFSDSSKDIYASYLIIPGEYATAFTKSVRKEIDRLSKKYPTTRLFIHKFSEAESFRKSINFVLHENESNTLLKSMELKENDFVIVAFGKKNSTLQLLGKIRTYYFTELQRHGATGTLTDHTSLVWITNWPLFEIDANRLTSCHHPFTSPHPDDIPLLNTDPLAVRSLSYDLVLNGGEIAGGSIRCHDPTMQRTILEDILQIDIEQLEHLLRALGSGCPPHGGIALGLDRLMSIVLGTQSIRDVIAFPKTAEGRDLMCTGPAKIQDDDLKYYHVSVRKELDD